MVSLWDGLPVVVSFLDTLPAVSLCRGLCRSVGWCATVPAVRVSDCVPVGCAACSRWDCLPVACGLVAVVSVGRMVCL